MMNLIDGKYTLPQIVDLQQFQTLLENFTRATGFTTALVSYPDQQLLITTGWRDVCTKFHRANWASAQHCVSSNRLQSQALAEQRLLNICPCENGLVDGATPVIIHGTHVASLATGQIFFAPPDEARFLRQAEQYGFDPDAYLAAVRAVPVVTEAQFEAALCFLRELAQLLAEQAIANLDSQAIAEALRSSEARARAILDSAEVGLLIVDAETHEILSVNPKAQALFETTEEHLLHRVCHRFICPAEVGKCPITDLKQVVDTSERELLNVRGESRPILKSVREIQLDGRACLLESYIDITAQKRVEAELQAANAQMHALLSAIPDLLFEYDREGHVLSFQTNDPSQLSLPPEQFLGHAISDILPAAVADKIIAGLDLAATVGFARNIEYQLTRSGVTRWYEMAISRCDPAGNRFLAVSHNVTERIQAQQALHDLQLQLTYLVDHTNDFIMQIDLDGNYCYCNAASEGFIGYTTGELLQMNIRQIAAPEYHPLLFARLHCRMLNQAIDERPYQIELLHRDGHRVWAELTTTVVYDAEQRPIAVQAIARNIDERKRFEQRLTALRDGFLHFGPDPVSNINRLTALAGELLTASCAIYHRLEGDNLRAVGCWHTPPDFPSVCAADGCICAGSITQQSPEPCVLHDLPHSPYAATDPHVRRYGLQTYIGYPVALQNANIGSLCVVYRQEYAPSDDDLQLLGILATAIGIEELRRQAIRDLAESEERYKALIQNAVEGIAAMDPKTERLKFFNPAFCAMFGYTADECANLALPDFHPPDARSRAQEEFRAKARGEGVDANALPCRRKDGSIFYADITGAPIVLEGESYLVGFFTDITERKRVEAERLEMERRLLHSQKLESLGVLAGGIAHDFNNLLMAILGNLDIALTDLPSTHPARAGIEQAMHASHHATDLTRQMLAYSGKGHVILDSLNLNTLVRDNTDIFRAAIARTITLTLEITPEIPSIIADPGQVQQVVMNLLTNASEAIGAKTGVITLVTGVRVCDSAYLQRSRLEEKPAPGCYVFVEVTDNGCGMDAGTLTKMFDPFFTTKFTGRGLGMSAVLGILQGHHGAIIIDSAVDQGTSIRVLFPACPDAAPAEPVSAPTDAQPDATSAVATPPCILVIDDEEMIRSICIRLLTRHGFAAVGAADGEEAIRLCQASAQDFACVLLDLTMPNMDGVATFGEIKRLHPDLPVILCSGYTEQEIHSRFSEHKPDDFLQKPYRPHELHATITRVLERRQAAALKPG